MSGKVVRGLDRTDWLLLLSLFLFPWVALVYESAPGSSTFVFAWGLVSPAGSVTMLPNFLARAGALPNWILAWPLGVGCLVAAFTNAVRGVARGREDVRLTAWLLVLVGVAALSVGWGFSGQPGRTGLPLGTVVAWLLAGRYWVRLRG